MSSFIYHSKAQILPTRDSVSTVATSTEMLKENFIPRSHPKGVIRALQNKYNSPLL